MTNKKGLTLMTGTVVALIILVIVIVMYSVFFVRSSAISADPIVAQCQQSAALSGILSIPLADQTVFDFRCPISHKEITLASISGKVPEKKLADFGYKNSTQYNLDKEMWRQTADCYQKVNFGILPIFSRNKIDGGQTYCVVCSVVSFDEKVNSSFYKKWLDPKELYFNETIRGYGKTIPQILYERTSMNTSSTLQSTIYNVRQNQAVVYFRIQSSQYEKFYSNTVGNLQIGQDASSTEAQYDALPTPISWLRFLPYTVPVATIFNRWLGVSTPGYVGGDDVDGIVILNYDPTKTDQLRGVCDIIGNEPYLAK